MGSSIRIAEFRGRTAVIIGTGILGATALTGCITTANGNSASCTSPRAVSDTYPGDKAALPMLQSTWKTGVEIDTEVPKDATGIEVGFRGPNGDWSDSAPISPDRADKAAVRIGPGDVIFSVRAVGRLGATACEAAPEVTFSQPEQYADILLTGAVLPSWG